MQPLLIIINFNVLKNYRFRLCSITKNIIVDTLNFQAMEKAFSKGIIVTVAFATHTTDEFIVLKQLLVFVRAILTTSVGVNDDTSRKITVPLTTHHRLILY